MKKIFLLLAVVSVALSAAAEPLFVVKASTRAYPFFPMGMSDNKQYVCVQDGGNSTGFLSLWDITDGKIEDIAWPDMEGFGGNTPNANNAYDVADNGMVVGAINGWAAYYNGETWVVLDEVSHLSCVNAVTADAKKMVGFKTPDDSDLNASRPVVWVLDSVSGNYLSDTLEWIRSYEAIYYDRENPEQEIGRDTIPFVGALATDISADGKIIGGVLYTDYGKLPGVIWEYSEAEKRYVLDPFTLKYLDFFNNKAAASLPYVNLMGMSVRVSPSGEWVTGEETAARFDENNWSVARYNTKTKELQLCSSADNITPGMAYTIADDGTVVGAWVRTVAMDRAAIIAYPGENEVKSFFDEMEAKGVVMPTDFDATSSAAYIISGDGRVIVGSYMSTSHNEMVGFVIDLDGKIASKIDDVVVDNDFCKASNGTLFLSGDVTNLRVISVSGQTVYSAENPQSAVSLNNINRGIYIVDGLKDGKRVVTKVSL